MVGPRYVPREVDDSVNVSKTHPLAEAGVLMLGLGIAFIAATIVIVYLVEILVGLTSVEAEMKWLTRITPDLTEQTEEAHAATGPANDLLDRLSAQWLDAPYDFKLEITDNPEPNAMALPGGLIIVTSGLLESIESENELAFVLGHELGHFRNRDHLRRMGRLTLLGILYTAVSRSGDIGFNISELTLRGFNRQQEAEADQFGLELTYALYGHVNASWHFFERLDQSSQGFMTGYLDSHPQTAARIDDIKQTAYNRRWRTDGELTPWHTTDATATTQDPL
ncbi:MAG: M48 family metallopeptidase [Woeseiaceae bacterium]